MAHNEIRLKVSMTSTVEWVSEHYSNCILSFNVKRELVLFGLIQKLLIFCYLII